MRETIEFLKKDCKVNQTFMNKLEEVGFEIEYKNYCYWNHEPYVQVGRDTVWLVESYSTGSGESIRYRYQNSVIQEIKKVLKEQKRLAVEADKEVEDFFNMYVTKSKKENMNE